MRCHRKATASDLIFKFKNITLLSDFQSELGCPSDFDPTCQITQFSIQNNSYALKVAVPAGRWNLEIFDQGNHFGQYGQLNGPHLSLILLAPSEVLFLYDDKTHELKISTAVLESRSMPPGPITITLEDTLIFDPNLNMIANPGDSIRYTMILKNPSSQSMLNTIITHSGDPSVTFDPYSVKASPLAFNDTFTYDAHPKNVIASMGLLSNDYDLNDPLPNPPYNANLTVVRVNGLASNIGLNLLTAGGGHVTVNANGSFVYDSAGVNGAQTDTWMYTILDQDGYYDSATVLMQFNMAPVIASNLALTDTICAFEMRDTNIMTIAFTISDDELNAESAKIEICTNYLSNEDTLIAGSLPGGITANWTDGSGTLMLMGPASLADFETAIEGIQYLNQSETPNSAIREICITVSDGASTSNQVMRLLKIKPINDCPTAVRDTFYVAEDDGMGMYTFPLSNVLDNDTDPDNDPLTASGLTNFPIIGGTVSLGGNGFFAFFRTIGFTGLDSLTDGEMFFARVQYTITDLTCTDSDSVIIKVTGVNDAPIIASNLSATDSICAFEQQDTFLVKSAFTLMDDDDQMDSAKISICLNYLSSEDTLIAGGLPGGITASWNDAAGTMMLMGAASKANYEAAIEAIQYTNQNNAPNTNSRRICISVHDGVLNSNQVTRELKIKPVNDCPTAVRDTLLITENGSTAAGNVIPNDTDPENDPLTVTMVNANSANTNLAINGGTINIATAGVVTFTHTTGAMGLDTLNLGQMFFARAQYTNSDGLCTDTDSVIIKITGINDAPTADSNAYSIAQTAALSIAAPGILADDKDIDHLSTITVGTVNGSNANVGTMITLSSGASLTMNANGSFIYSPNCVAGGIDSFSYQVIDEHMALSNTVKVYFTISQSMWFVNNAGANGSGSFGSPFNTLLNAQTASAIGDYIFVFPGTYNENITLKNNQKLIGADENWLCPTGNIIRPASGNTTITGTVTLAMNDTIKGIEFVKNSPSPLAGTLEQRSSGSNVFIKDNGASVGNLLVSNTTVNVVLDPWCGMVLLNGGNLNVTFDTYNSTGQVTAIQTNSCSGALTLSSGSIDPFGTSTGDTLIKITGGSHSAIIQTNIAQDNNSPICYIGGAHNGTITFQTGAISASSGTGLQFDDADGTYNFNGTTTLSGGDAGIDILNGSIGTFSFSSGTTITRANGVSGAAFNLLSSNANVTYSGSMTLGTSTGNMVAIDNHDAGTMTFNTGNLTKATSTTQGISIQNSGGGTINFNNPTISITMTSGNAISLTGANAGGTINFAPAVGGNGIDLVTTSGIGFNSTGGGTISMTGTSNTISSTTGTALNVVSTTLGASGLNFQSISSNGGPNGIILNGTSGNLTVNGDGSGFANGSGGSLSNITGNGPVSLVSVSGIITLKSMHMSLNINCVFGMLVDNLTSGNITTNITGCTFIGVGGLSNVVQNKALLQFDVGASSVSNVNVQNSFFYDNRSYGIAAVSAGNSTMNVTVNQCGFGTETNTGSPINNPGTTITNPPPFSLLVSNSSSALVDYNITNNTFWGADGSKGAIYAVTISGATTLAGSHLIGSFSNNKIGKSGVVGSGASNNSAGLGLLPGVAGTFQATVSNNDIRQVNSFGINFKNSVTGATGTSNVKIAGNTIIEPDVTGSPVFLRAIVVDPGNSGGASMTACAEIGGSTPGEKNNISGAWQALFHIRVTNNNTVALRLPGLSPASGATAAQVNTFVENNNTITAGNVGAALGTAGIVGGAICF